MSTPRNHPLYRDHLPEEKTQLAAHVHPLHRAYLQQEGKMPMDELAEIHSLQRLRFQEEMARLREEKDRELRWGEVPIVPYQRAISFPSIYGPPARLATENNGIRLVPQPTVSPEDPLNWSWWKKHAVLAALIPGCLLSDWTLTWGTTVFELQAPEWYVR